MNDFAVLNTGRKMPLIGLGTWKSEPGKVEANKYRNHYFSAQVRDEVKQLLLAKLAERETRCTPVDEEPVGGSSAELGPPDTDTHTAKRFSLLFAVHNEILQENIDKEKQLASPSAMQVKQAVVWALEAGYRHLDCASIYANETEVGDALQEVLGSDKSLRREDVFITSKLWNTCHQAEDVEPALLKTLKDLKLDYLDLYLMHWPYAFQRGNVPFPRKEDGTLLYDDTDYKLTWAAMEKLVEKGLVRSIGLSNFNSRQIDDILSVARIKPTVLQVESHPYLAQVELLAHCRDQGLVMTAYSPLGSPDRAWKHPDEPVLLQEPVIASLAEKYKMSPAQIILRWQTQRGVVTIPKSVTKSRIQENIQVFDFTLEAEEMKSITALNRGWRYIVPMIEVEGKRVPRDAGHRYYPFNEPY